MILQQVNIWNVTESMIILLYELHTLLQLKILRCIKHFDILKIHDIFPFSSVYFYLVSE